VTENEEHNIKQKHIARSGVCKRLNNSMNRQFLPKGAKKSISTVEQALTLIEKVQDFRCSCPLAYRCTAEMK
jgi:hypothetical protein